MNETNHHLTQVVAGLIYRDGRLLVCQRRADAAFALKWEFPGGKVEPTESDMDALRRELKEELDIEAGDAEFFCAHEHAYREGPRVSLRFYLIRAFVGEVKNLVFERISWLEPAALKSLDFLDGDWPLVSQLSSSSLPGIFET